MTSTIRATRLRRIFTASIPSWVLATLGVLVILSIITIAWWNKPPPTPLYQKYTTLSVGMTEQQVTDHCVGYPVTDDRKALYYFFRNEHGERKSGFYKDVDKVLVVGNNDQVWVVLNADNRVVRKKYYRQRP